MLARDGLALPLMSHGYLMSIIAGMGNKAEAKVEAQKEAALRDRPTSSESTRKHDHGSRRLTQEDRDKGRAAVAQLVSQFRL